MFLIILCQLRFELNLVVSHQFVSVFWLLILFYVQNV